jgi:mannose-1-phosphate guanylyltransferase
MKSGQYLWNAGAFVFGVNSILKAIREHAPDIYSLLMRAEGADLNKVYSAFPDISIDYAVMERAGNIFCVMGNYRWKDIGSFEVLKEVLTQESRGFVEKNGKIIKIL